jgi:protein-tyrosine phosphatase
VLFHCAGGKDRTGMLAALLLRLAGVPLEAVDEDYVRSEARLRLGGRAPSNAVAAPRDVVARVLGEAEARHGSSAAYLLHAGASATQLERIRGRFLAR